MKRLLTTLAILAAFTIQGLALSIDGSFVTIDPVESENGSATLCFFAFNGSVDAEWITDVIVTLPDCMTIVDPPPASAVPESGTNFIVDPDFAGYGTNVAQWHGEDDLGYGFLTGGAGGFFCIGVEINCDCDNVYPINWVLIGDGWGDPPHLVAGDLEFTVLCSTPVEDSSLSDIKSLY